MNVYILQYDFKKMSHFIFYDKFKNIYSKCIKIINIGKVPT